MRTIAAMLLLSATALAQTPETRCLQAHYDPSWGVVQVFSQEVGETRVGTGMCVARMDDGQGLFLTCDHCSQGERVLVRAEGINSEARVVARQAENDVALLEARIPDRHPMGVVVLAQAAPQGVAPWDGFSPGRGQYRRYDSQIRPIPEVTSHFYSHGRLLDGMSGGPVLDHNYRVGGMIVARGTRNNWGLAVSSEWIRNWMASELEGEHLAAVASRQRLRSVPEDFQLVSTVRLNPEEWRPVAWKTPSPPSIFD